MRFLALETNVQEIQKTLIAEGEELLLSTHHHFFSFLFPVLLDTFILTLGIGIASAFGVIVGTSGAAFIMSWAVISLLSLYAYMVFTAYVEWRYNFLIITTMKVVIVEQHSIFKHVVLPIHLDTISSVSFGLRFFGIGRCGSLNIHLTERLDGSTRNIILHYMPTPDVVTGIIENASALIMQKAQEGERKEDQRGKIETVQQKAEKVSGKEEPVPTASA